MRQLLYAALMLVVSFAAAGCTGRVESKRFRMGMMPKIKSIAYFNACHKGAEEAAAERDIDLVYDGPAKDDINEQIRMLEQWITQGYQCIAVAPNHPSLIVPVLKRAQAKGITVLT